MHLVAPAELTRDRVQAKTDSLAEKIAELVGLRGRRRTLLGRRRRSLAGGGRGLGARYNGGFVAARGARPPFPLGRLGPTGVGWGGTEPPSPPAGARVHPL